jgi:arginine decarboxylase
VRVYEVRLLPNLIIPNRFFLVSGSSDGFSQLNAFDGALIKAGIGDTNLIRLSSILPPYCEQIEPFHLPPGCLLTVAYAGKTSDKKGEIISAAVAVGIPKDRGYAGLIMEYSDTLSEAVVHAKVRAMAAEGMKMRNREVSTILSISSTHKVEHHGGVFAGVVLLNY